MKYSEETIRAMLSFYGADEKKIEEFMADLKKEEGSQEEMPEEADRNPFDED